MLLVIMFVSANSISGHSHASTLINHRLNIHGSKVNFGKKTKYAHTNFAHANQHYFNWLLFKVLHPTRHKIGRFGDALPSQSLN